MQNSRDCWSMNSNDSVWLDPLHLPRAPILQHNVSLCHGRATPLFSPSATPAASSVAWSRVYGILDFGNSNSTAEYRSRRSFIGEETHRGRWRKTVFQHALPLRITPFPSTLGVAAFVSRCLSTPFSESTSESMMQPRMSCENIVAFVMPTTLYPSCGGPLGNNDSSR